MIFTDGDDTTSQVPPQEVQRLVRSSEVTIYPVAFPGEQRPNSADALRARSFLHALAEPTGGQVFQPTASRELAGDLPDDPRRAGQRSTCSATSRTTRSATASFRRITVELKRPELKVRHRPGYDAPKDEPPLPSPEEDSREPRTAGRAGSASGGPSSDSTLRSSSRRRRCSSGSLANTAIDLSQARFSIAGEPETTAPGSSEPGMPRLGGGDRRRRRSSRWPATPTWPGERHAAADPRAAGDADLAGEHRVLADRDRVADLHQVVELRAAADAGLAERGAVDRGEGADLDVVLDHHDPDLRELVVAARRASRAKPKPSPPITAPFCTTTRLPSRQRSRTCTPECSTQSSPTSTPVVEHHVRVEHAARADADARARRPRARRRARPRRGPRVASTCADGWTPGRRPRLRPHAAPPRARRRGRGCRRRGRARAVSCPGARITAPARVVARLSA